MGTPAYKVILSAKLAKLRRWLRDRPATDWVTWGLIVLGYFFVC